MMNIVLCDDDPTAYSIFLYIYVKHLSPISGKKIYKQRNIDMLKILNFFDQF